MRRSAALALYALSVAAIVIPNAWLVVVRPAGAIALAGPAAVLPAAGFWLLVHTAARATSRRPGARPHSDRALVLGAAALLVSTALAGAGAAFAVPASAALVLGVVLSAATGIRLLFAAGRAQAARMAIEAIPGERKPARSPRNLALAIVLAAVALWPRFCGLEWGLPYAYHSDEAVLYGNALRPDLHPGTFAYPALMIYVNKALAMPLALARSAASDRATLADVLASADLRVHTIRASRVAVSLMGASMVVLVFWGLLRLGASTALAAIGGLVIALSPGLVRHAHYDTVDVPCAVLAAASILLVLVSVKDENPRQLLRASVMAGLAAGAKYPGAVLLVPIAAGAMILAARAGRPRTAAIPLLLTCAGILVLTFVVVNPYAVVEWPRVAHGVLHQASHSRAGHVGAQPERLDFLAGPLAAEFGVSGLLLPLAAALVMLRRAPRELVLSWGTWVLPLGALFLSHLVKFSRWFIPILPEHVLLPVLAAIPPGRGRVLLVASLSVMIAESGVRSFGVATEFAAPDTRTIAREWIRAHIPAGSVLAVPGFDDPDRFEGAPQDLASLGYRLQMVPILTRSHEIPAGWNPDHLMGDRVDYFVWSEQAFARYSTAGAAAEFPELNAAYERLRRWLEEDSELAFTCRAEAGRAGPEIRIYRLPAAAPAPR